MEKLKPTTKLETTIKGPRGPEKPDENEAPRFEQFKKDWDKSVFKDGAIMDKIKEISESIQKDNEYSAEELGELATMMETMSKDAELLEEGLQQNQFKDIRKSVLGILFNLMPIGSLMSQNNGGDALIRSIRSITDRNIDSFADILKDRAPGYEYAKHLLYSSIGTSFKAYSIFKDYLHQAVTKKSFDALDIKIVGEIIRKYRDYRDYEVTADEYAKAVSAYIKKNPQDYQVIVACLNEGDAPGMSIFSEIARKQIKKNLEKFDFGRDELTIMITKWQFAGGSNEYMPEAFIKNIEVMETIEKERPGIIKFLMSKFGIYNFGRYPENMLIEQYDQYENQDLPYGVAVFAEDDHNATYFEDQEELQEMHDGFKGKYTVRIAEASGKKDILRLMARLRLKYGEKHKISFAVVAAHGNRDMITLGNVGNVDDREIFVEDVLSYGGRKYELFEKDATIIVLSCRSGQGGAIGSKISKVLGRTVIAPSDDSGLHSIKPIIKESGKLDFKVKYTHKARAARYSPRKKQD